MEDDLWRGDGFQDYARAESWRGYAASSRLSLRTSASILANLNHRNREAAFSQEEMRLLNIVQPGGTNYRNLTLVQQARQRAQRSEA